MVGGLRRRAHGWRLWALCYTAGLVLLLLWQLGAFAYNRALHAGGTLPQVQLTLEDFTLHDLYPLPDGSLATVGPDPQLVLADTGLRADSIELVVRYQNPPRMAVAFYTARPGQDHSVKNMAYAAWRGDTATFTLPAGGGYSLRIDPDTAAGNILWVEGIALNPHRGLGSFLRPRAGQVVCLVFVPGLAACLADILGRRRKGVARHG